MTKDEIDAFFTTGISGAATSLIIRILVIILIFVIGSKLIKFTIKLVQKSMEKMNAERGLITFICSFLKVALYVVLAFILASKIGVDAASIVAILGSAGVAIGLAIQGSLSNFAGGVLILLLKPFKVGDYIVDSAGHEGTVYDIQIFYTKLHTFDNKVVVLPNGNLANNCITNVTAEKVRRVDVNVQIAYGADLKKAQSVLMDMLSDNEYVLKDQICRVIVNSLDDSGVTLCLHSWVKGENYWPAKWDITEKCKLALDENNIEIPFPQVDVHMKNS